MKVNLVVVKEQLAVFLYVCIRLAFGQLGLDTKTSQIAVLAL